MLNYKIKYLKYKTKYLQLKNKNFEDLQKKLEGGTELHMSCKEYYLTDNDYTFINFDSLKEFLINLSGINNKWNNYENIYSNYENTVLHELIKINFDFTKYKELPEIVKIILNVKLKPSHMLEMVAPEYINFIKNILNNNSNSSITEGLLKSFISNKVNERVINEIKNILLIDKNVDPNTVNGWKAITILLEFIGCLTNQYFLNASLGLIKQSIRDGIDGQVLLFVFLEDLIFVDSRKKFINLYPKNKNNKTNDNFDCKNFVLKDFLNPSKNVSIFFPPSVLLLLSIKINPLINKRGNNYNTEFRKNMEILYKCDYQNLKDIKPITDFLNDDSQLNSKDSNLIDEALAPIENIPNQDINDNLTIFQKIGVKYTEISFDLNKTIKNNLSSIFNFFKNKDTNDRKNYLENKIISLNQKIKELTQSNQQSSFFNLFESKESKMFKLKQKLNNANIELNQLKNPKDPIINKINYIYSSILLMSGLGIDVLKKDICTIGEDSHITWRTFDKLIQLIDSYMFKIISFAASKTLMNLLIQNISPYLVYLPLNINSYIFEKINMTDIQKKSFEDKTQLYSKLLFKNFVHLDGYYYIDNSGKKFTSALFPPSDLANVLIVEVNTTII